MNEKTAVVELAEPKPAGDEKRQEPKSNEERREEHLRREKMELRRERMKAQLKEWGIDLEIFNLRAEKAGTELRAEYHKQIEALRPRVSEAREQLHQLKHTAEPAADEMFKGMEKAWAELSKAFESASAKFKKAEPVPMVEPTQEETPSPK